MEWVVMKMVTIPVKGYWVICKEDDYNEEFGSLQFEAADEYLNEKRKERPELTFTMIADIEA